jgi:hypothetical protein
VTTNERAKQAILRSTISPHFSQWWAITISPEQIEALTHTIEDAINAAVEEDRKSRECCKAEREACVGIAARKVLEKLEQKKRLNCCSCMAEEIEREIRARSDS